MSEDYIKKNIVLFCLKIFFTITNSVNPDEMQHYGLLLLYCLQKYSFRFPKYKGLSCPVICHLSRRVFSCYVYSGGTGRKSSISQLVFITDQHERCYTDL